jgi:hypothetical protein
MDSSQRIPIIAGIIGFIADIIGTGTFLVAMQSPRAPAGRAVPIMILVIICYSWFILAWAISRLAISREIERARRAGTIPFNRWAYRLLSSIGVGLLASPIVLLTTTNLDPTNGLRWGAGLLVAVGISIDVILSMLMPLVHDESAYTPT